MADHTTQLREVISQRLSQGLPYTVQVYDAEPDDTARHPHIILYGGQQATEGPRYHGGTQRRAATWRAMAVSRTAAGARALIADLTTALHGTNFAGNQLTCQWPSEPLWDRDDPTVWKWTATVEIHHHT